MKKIFIAITFLFALALSVNAQQADNRITAILDKEPAKNATELNANAIATAALGEDGIVTLLSQLQPIGQGDNTKIFDAISGFSFYVTQKGKEEWRAMAVKAYSKALAKASDKENQAFIISQLQMTGKDDAIAALHNYLNDERLCDPAARALVKINSPAAKAALLKALPASKGACTLSLVEALGDSRNTLAVKSINATIGKDKKLTKVALYALANIADPVSINLLANAAQRAGFTYDETNATSAYLLYIKNLGSRGKAQIALRLAKTLSTKASLANQIQTKTAALKLQVDMQGAKSTPLLIEAARNNNQKYRDAALKFAGPYLTPANITLWTNELAKADTTEKAAIITMLGNNRVRPALRAVVAELKNENEKVVIAAITAAGQIGQDKILNNLFRVLKTGTPNEDLAVQNALLVMSGHDLPQRSEKQVAYMPPGGQVALVNLFAARHAHEQMDVVIPLLNSGDMNVRAAAYSALKYLAAENNLEDLLALMSSPIQPKETMEVQSSIITVIGQMKDRSVETEPVLKEMDKAEADKKSLYYNVLAAIGDKKSLNAVSKAYDQGSIDTKHAAITALSQWVDISAAPQLFNIAKTNNDAGLKDQALRGYIATINKSTYPADEKVIYLRDAMEVAQTVQQKQLILQETANNKTFPALLFVGSYLYDPQLQEDAANSVVSIALSSKDFYGDAVKRMLNRTIQLRKGGDSDYEREAIKKFIAEMPADAGLAPLFNNKDLAGWKGLMGNPIERGKMDAATLEKAQQKADETMKKGWYVKDSVLNFTGEGENICTTKQYRNFEMYVDWKILTKGDAGIYLRGSPQVQIWDTSRVDAGAQVGSGGLYNNQAHQSKPLKLADNAIGDWNTFHIIMKGDKVTVYLNGILVVDQVIMDNYWDRNQPIFPKEQIELQAHGNHVYYRDIYLRELAE
ncbi:MAG TPA: DUF1080 domain-containing protein [Mucilaginibacter sp.]|nr:DUF1080 domain-containing protein [Mucilaginibacter sp.]